MTVLGVSEMGVKSRLKTVWLLRMYMIDLTDSCFEGVKIRNKDEISWYLVPKNNGHGEK